MFIHGSKKSYYGGILEDNETLKKKKITLKKSAESSIEEGKLKKTCKVCFKIP